MDSTNIARMDEKLFDFSEEARRIHIKPCGHKACGGYGEYRSFSMHNGIPRMILLCQRHDREATERDNQLEGEAITDIATLMQLFKILLNGGADETPQIEGEPEDAPQERVPILDFEEPDTPTDKVIAIPAPAVPVESRDEALREAVAADRLTWQMPVFKGEPLYARPGDDYFFCGECENPRWVKRPSLDPHMKSHGYDSVYEGTWGPVTDFRCTRHELCMKNGLSYDSEYMLEQHIRKCALPKLPEEDAVPTTA